MPTDLVDIVQTWRQAGADRIDPVRFGVIEALQRRVALARGRTRTVLEQRLATLIQAYANALDRNAAATHLPPQSASPDAGSATRSVPARGPIGLLTDQMAPGFGRAAALTDPGPASAQAEATVPPEQPGHAAGVDEVKRLWTQMHARQQLQRSLDQSPSNAGPLNSGQLVYRLLVLMREVSPGYLRQFVLYADTLSWLDQLRTAQALGQLPDVAPVGRARRGRRKTGGRG